jgi:pimeloyl-ACP methyl ester carboxylesterase
MIAEKFAASWEEKKRPYRVRSFRVDGYRQPEAAPWTETDWRSLSEGPALLFIHGTFSRAHSAFGHLPEETMRELHRRYEERVFAFDHKTLSADPDENVKWLLASMPEGVPIEADVICHSRGGLVSRALATADGPIAVRKLLFVASPNDGTILCDPAHMIQLIDRYTNLATLLAPEVIGDVLEAVITVVKLIGRAGLVKLEGLAAMNRGGAFLRGLASRERDAADYYAIAADYEPEGGALRAIVGGAADLLMDRVFEDASNDLVVPTDGVHTGARSRRFPIDEARRLVLASSSAVHHGGFFSCADVNRKILDWLRP